MKNLCTLPAALVLAASLTAPAFAQAPAQAATVPASAQQSKQVATMAAGDFARGEVRKVDKANGKVTVKHGELLALDMPPMTMVFVARDRTLLDRVKPGESVMFRAANENGTFYILEVKAAQ